MLTQSRINLQTPFIFPAPRGYVAHENHLGYVLFQQDVCPAPTLASPLKISILDRRTILWPGGNTSLLDSNPQVSRTCAKWRSSFACGQRASKWFHNYSISRSSFIGGKSKRAAGCGGPRCCLNATST
jgi:hypothetical protein